MGCVATFVKKDGHGFRHSLASSCPVRCHGRRLRGISGVIGRAASLSVRRTKPRADDAIEEN